jgi:hypothetical protein
MFPICSQVTLSNRFFPNEPLWLRARQRTTESMFGPMKDSQDREVSIILKRDRHCFDSTAL